MRKILCALGWHSWTASLIDYIEEFGCVPLGGKVASNSKCERCGAKYKKK